MRNALILCILLWAVAFIGSFVAFYADNIPNFGLPGAWNKLGVFVILQLVATVLAAVCLGMRWAAKDRWLKAWAAIPSLAIGVMLVIVFAMYLQAGAR